MIAPRWAKIAPALLSSGTQTKHTAERWQQCTAHYED